MSETTAQTGTAPLTGADFIARRLAAAGAHHAFGIPGGEVLALMGALEDAGIAFHLVKHENAGGFMAEGAWHAEARKGPAAPGILLATLGPGVANAVNVVANAWQDQVPMIIVGNKLDLDSERVVTQQEGEGFGLVTASDLQEGATLITVPLAAAVLASASVGAAELAPQAEPASVISRV